MFGAANLQLFVHKRSKRVRFYLPRTRLHIIFMTIYSLNR